MTRPKVEGIKATVEQFDETRREAESVRARVRRALEDRPFWPERRVLSRVTSERADGLPPDDQ